MLNAFDFLVVFFRIKVDIDCVLIRSDGVYVRQSGWIGDKPE